MAWKLAFSPGAVRDLKKLDKSVQRTVLSKLRWFADNFTLAHKARLEDAWILHYKLRVGDYRILYRINERVRWIQVDYIDHRSRIYKRRKRM